MTIDWISQCPYSWWVAIPVYMPCTYYLLCTRHGLEMPGVVHDFRGFMLPNYPNRMVTIPHSMYSSERPACASIPSNRRPTQSEAACAFENEWTVARACVTRR